ncbi:hypothetical protein DFR58_12133 [Anaerobacterium chartisolvens]|uniref:Amphi-Trp domain-containing protein n=1 Tax=Anaerobacterium chartisolvens TaxID=1297424 RepID=A0A369AT58_9FIRM|nr:transcription initiation factor IIE [Anaerobacterium chartisolvens]RCX12529.1 hypothetical protein DFR58_12133 [Anaerobacterium chartisolvens]
MKYSRGELCSKSELGSILKKLSSQLLSGDLQVEGQYVKIPEGLDLDVKVKYSTNEDGGSLTIKISWDLPCDERDTEEDI